MHLRIFYAAGPGDVIQAHKHWAHGERDPSQMSITFSSQFNDFCQDIGAEAYIVAWHDRKEIFRDHTFTIEHRSKPIPNARGILFHLSEILYGLSLLATAIRFRANWALLHSGSTHYFVMSLFRLAGIRVVPLLHNSLWPCGFPPRRPIQLLIMKLDSWFFRLSATSAIGVSPECLRQIDELTRGRHGTLHEIRAQYSRDAFANVMPPPSLDSRPFRILFLGRVDTAKGAMDILQIARTIEDRAPKRVHWDICGTGPAYKELQQQHLQMNLESVVSLHGWTTPQDQSHLRSKSHASIVPTRSTFAEGLAMTAVESILTHRPVITCRVVPAIEILRPACLEAKPDDVDSYAETTMKLIDDACIYQALCDSCSRFEDQFYDGKLGLRAVLKTIISPIDNR